MTSCISPPACSADAHTHSNQTCKQIRAESVAAALPLYISLPHPPSPLPLDTTQTLPVGQHWESGEDVHGSHTSLSAARFKAVVWSEHVFVCFVHMFQLRRVLCDLFLPPVERGPRKKKNKRKVKPVSKMLLMWWRWSRRWRKHNLHGWRWWTKGLKEGNKIDELTRANKNGRINVRVDMHDFLKLVSLTFWFLSWHLSSNIGSLVTVCAWALTRLCVLWTMRDLSKLCACCCGPRACHLSTVLFHFCASPLFDVRSICLLKTKSISPSINIFFFYQRATPGGLSPYAQLEGKRVGYMFPLSRILHPGIAFDFRGTERLQLKTL